MMIVLNSAAFSSAVSRYLIQTSIVSVSSTGDRHSAAHIYLFRTGRVRDQRKLPAGAGNTRCQCGGDDPLQLQLITQYILRHQPEEKHVCYKPFCKHLESQYSE